jgi:predicted RND superfamily exporter protein
MAKKEKNKTGTNGNRKDTSMDTNREGRPGMYAVNQWFEERFAHLAETMIRWRWVVLASVLSLTAILASQTAHLTIDTRDESFFRDDDPVLVAYNRFRDTYGQDDTFIIGLVPQQGLDRSFMNTLVSLHQELEQEVPWLDEVTSLVNGRLVRAEGDTLVVEELMETPPADGNEMKRITRIIRDTPMFDRLLVAPDHSLACILVKARAVIEAEEEDLLAGFDPAPGESKRDEKLSPAGESPPHTFYLSNQQNVAIDAAIQKVTARYADRGITFHYSGTPAFIAQIQKAIEKDLATMIPLSFGIIILFLLLLFRRISGVVYPLITVAFSLLSTLGIMALLGVPITNAIQILPTFLIVVGIGDSVHILTLFYREHQSNGGHRRAAVVAAVGCAGLPVLMTSITTSLGLLSFVLAEVAIIAQLGWVAPIGVMLAFVYTVVLLPALIAVFPIRQRPRPAMDKAPLADRAFDHITRLTMERPIAIVAVFAVLTVAALTSALSVRFSHNALTWFPDNNPIRSSTETLDRVNGGTVMLEAVIDSGEKNGMQDPDRMARLDRAGKEIPPYRCTTSAPARPGPWQT